MLELDSRPKEAVDGYQHCMMAHYHRHASPEAVHMASPCQATAGPEVQKTMSDPGMRLILEQMQRDPKSLSEHFKNAVTA